MPAIGLLPETVESYASSPQQLLTYATATFLISVSYIISGVRRGAVGWGTALQTGRLRVRFPMVPLQISIGVIFPVTLWP
jgi:hypothetical protein